MTEFLIGGILFLIVGVFLGANVSGDSIVNKIGKIKGKEGTVNVEQVQTGKPKKEKRKGFLRKIFTSKKKRNEQQNR